MRGGSRAFHVAWFEGEWLADAGQRDGLTHVQQGHEADERPHYEAETCTQDADAEHTHARQHDPAPVRRGFADATADVVEDAVVTDEGTHDNSLSDDVHEHCRCRLYLYYNIFKHKSQYMT